MPGVDPNALTDALGALIHRWVAPLIRYRASYPARVIAQHEDLSLDVQPDDPTMPGLCAIPMRGLPGVRVEVTPGARVLVSFENGDRRLPVATLFEVSGLKSLTIEAAVSVTVNAPSVALGGPGGAPVARLGDAVQVMVTSASGPATGTILGGSATVSAS
jgi:hypothetical protein